MLIDSRLQLVKSPFPCVRFFQGARVWVKEKEQLVPATVNSCGDGTLVLTTDYGEVGCVERTSFHPPMCTQEWHRLRCFDKTGFWGFLREVKRHVCPTKHRIDCETLLHLTI